MDNNTEKDTDVILEVKDLKTYFKTGPHKVVKAVEGVNFSLRKGKVLGIIGESGSGKSVTARSILRIVESPGYIGPLVIDNLYVTRHLDTPGKPDLVMSAICPGVMAQTGIETVDIVRGICDEIDVEIVVAIDALAARSSKRLGCTIQLTDTGISPGSGVGNNRKTLSSDNLGRRVIAVGVPTVISVPSIIDDSLDEVADAFNETYGRRIMREFTEKQRYQIACNLLDEDMADMFVTPKNIDELVRRISFTISEAINAIAM